jgi:beta-glucosidase
MAPQATQAGFFENLNSPAGDEIKKLAAASDISIVFTANNKEYESESFDRDSMSLTPLQNDLISMVAEASAKTVLVNQTGGPYHHVLAQQRGRSITVLVRRPRSGQCSR